MVDAICLDHFLGYFVCIFFNRNTDDYKFFYTFATIIRTNENEKDLGAIILILNVKVSWKINVTFK